MPKSKYKEKASNLRNKLNEIQPTIDELTKKNKMLEAENILLRKRLNRIGIIVNSLHGVTTFSEKE